MKRRNMNSIEYVSLFSGAMGLDLGLEKKGFHAALVNDVDPVCVATMRRNRPKLPIFDGDVSKATKDVLGRLAGKDLAEVPLVAGGPPCQAFSVFGKRKGVEDQRGKLIFEFIRLISEIRPLTFLMENVRGLHSMPLVPPSKRKASLEMGRDQTAHGSLLREVIRRFEGHGYRMDCFLVNAVNYGAPQLRERLICIGNRFNLKACFPRPQFSNRPDDCLPPFRTLRDVIGNGFKDPDPSLMNFSQRKLKYLAMVPPGGNWRSLPEQIQKESMGKSWYLKGGRSAYWRKLSFDFPCPTVVTMPNHAGTSMCHPSEVRALTVGELAAVQEFPHAWMFAGSPTEKCRQIGNAVPVRLGEVAGEVIRELLSRIEAAGRKPAQGPMLASRIEHLRPHVRTRTFWKAGQVFAGNHGYYDENDEGSEDEPLQRGLFDSLEEDVEDLSR